MISTLDVGPGVLGYHVDGKLQREDIDRAYAELDRTLASAEKIRVYAEVDSLSGTPGALWEDLRQGFQHWNVIPRIEKVAVVTDLGWVRNVTELEDKLFRGMDMRVFPLARAAEARSWIQA